MKLHRHLIEAALDALRQIFAEKLHADQVVADFFERHPKWGSRDRRLFAETVYDIVRWWRWYDFLSGGDGSSTKPNDERIRQVWGAYWLERGGELPDFIESEGLAETVTARKAAEVTRAIRASVPDWFDARGEQELGDQWPAILDSLNDAAPVFLRTNRLRASAEKVAAALAREDIEAVPVPGLPEAFRLETRRNLRNTRAYTDGLFEIQDANSQKIVPMLEVAPGMTVVDACAGAGGKTLQIAATMFGQGRLIAMDIHLPKLNELRRRAKRASALNIETRHLKSDAAVDDLCGQADRLLLDVPCSGSGVLRRMPDAKWKLRPGDLDRLCQVQGQILRRHAPLVRPGGAMVYATCSIFPSENTRQVHAFLAESTDWKLEAEQQLFPASGAGDGFYAARLRRSS